MATYNWAYRPNVQNKYNNETKYGSNKLPDIPKTAENIRPSQWIYVAIFGNDVTGNGSRQYPYKTIAKANTIATGQGMWIVVGSGVYRETIDYSQTLNIIGDGEVIIDITTLSDHFTNGYPSNFYNIRFRGGRSLILVDYYHNSLYDCVLEGMNPGLGISNPGVMDGELLDCIITDAEFNYYRNSYGIGAIKNITFVRCNIRIEYSEIPYSIQNIIFDSCNICFTVQPQALDFCLFYNCNFRFDTRIAFEKVFYPLVPTGFTYANDINSIKQISIAAFGASNNNFNNCIFSDPKFNNPAIGDYSLAYDSPAKNASYEGTYIGAKSIANSIKVRADLAQGGFDWSAAVNLNIADDSITVIDPSQGGSVETTVIVNAMGREIAGLPVYGFNADRNGQYVDATADLVQGTLNTSGSLAQGTPYLVEGGAITYNGNVYQPGETFTTTAITSFTTSTSGTVREILEAPQRHTVLARFGDGAPDTISSGTNLTLGYWYMVENSPVTYNARIYNVGEVFKSSDNSAFSGTGVVRLVMSTESYHYYEIGAKPYSNNEENIRTGAILRGNGDPAYVRGIINTDEFPINAKFIQLKYIVQVANLKP